MPRETYLKDSKKDFYYQYKEQSFKEKIQIDLENFTKIWDILNNGRISIYSKLIFIMLFLKLVDNFNRKKLTSVTLTS